MNLSSKYVQPAGMFLLALALIILTGCGSRQEGRSDVSGTVKLQGQFVPAGMIYFDPDGTKGNNGPQGVARIKDGKYDTRDEGKGGPGGFVVVRIEGFDGKAEGQNELGKPVFTYEKKMELPQGSTTKDFDLTAAEVRRAVVPTGPAP